MRAAIATIDPTWGFTGRDRRKIRSPPPSPVMDHGPVHDLELVPYGTARLRVMEFPVAIGRRD